MIIVPIGRERGQVEDGIGRHWSRGLKEEIDLQLGDWQVPKVGVSAPQVLENPHHAAARIIHGREQARSKTPGNRMSHPTHIQTETQIELK